MIDVGYRFILTLPQYEGVIMLEPLHICCHDESNVVIVVPVELIFFSFHFYCFYVLYIDSCIIMIRKRNWWSGSAFGSQPPVLWFESKRPHSCVFSTF